MNEAGVFYRDGVKNCIEGGGRNHKLEEKSQSATDLGEASKTRANSVSEPTADIKSRQIV